MNSVVVVGASLAGIRAAEALRSQGFSGAITLIGAEPHLPYNRPPLSKQALVGEWSGEGAPLIQSARLAELDLDLRLGVAATKLDIESRRVQLADGASVHYDGLVIATGARARQLPGTERLDGVRTLRTLEDAQSLRAHFESRPRRLLVCGAGFIGAEVASSARNHGIEVTLIEQAPVPFERALGPMVGAACAQLQTEGGVDLRAGVGVSLLEGGRRVEAALLTDGDRIPADLVVVGIGAIPNTEWLEGSGLHIDDGVVCDETCRAAPDVVVAGDVARWPNACFDGELMRVEHWENAVQQAAHAAATLLAGASGGEPFAPVPWFWSDQFDRTIQLAGRVQPGDETVILGGSLADKRFAAAYGRQGRLVAVVGFNRPREVARCRTLIAERVSMEDALEIVGVETVVAP